MLRERNGVARSLRGSGGGVGTHDARAVAENGNGPLAHRGGPQVVDDLNERFRRRLHEFREHAGQVLRGALTKRGDMLPHLAGWNGGAMGAAMAVAQ